MSKSQNGKPKGIDDAINEKHEVTTISGEAADHHLKIIASQHGLNLDHKGDKEEWPDAPEEIPTHPDLPDINAESIPPLFRNYIQTCCENLQVPFLFVLIPLMFSMSAIIGSGLRLRPKKMDKSWHVTSNLWAILIGPPSVKKSPSLEAGLAPLKYVEAYERERYESESKLWESKFQALEAERQGVLDAIKRKAAGNKDSQELTATLEDRLKSIISELSKAPKRIQIHTNDSTQEALLSLESNNRTGISIVRDELVGLIKKITNDRDSGHQEFYIEGFNGTSSYSSNRVTKNAPRTESHCISLIGTSQPFPIGFLIKSIKSNPTENNGFIQRFQATVIHDEPFAKPLVDKRRDHDNINEINAMALNVHKQIRDIANTDEQFLTIDFNEAAQDKYLSLHNEIYNIANLNSDNPYLNPHLLKSHKTLCSFAIIFEVVKHVELHGHLPTEVGMSSLLSAWDLLRVLIVHAHRLYEMDVKSDVGPATALLERILKQDITHGMKIRDIKRKGWSQLKDKSSVDGALACLEELGWCRVSREKKDRGASSNTIHLHPSLRT